MGAFCIKGSILPLIEAFFLAGKVISAPAALHAIEAMAWDKLPVAHALFKVHPGGPEGHTVFQKNTPCMGVLKARRILLELVRLKFMMEQQQEAL